MTRLTRRQTFIFILISLLVYGLTCYGLSSSVGEPEQAKMPIFGSSTELPLRGKDSYPAPSPLWQVNQNNIAFVQNVIAVSSNRVPLKSLGNIRSAVYYCQHNTDSGHAGISLRIIDSFNTAFKLVDGQAYLHLDIPPPNAIASL